MATVLELKATARPKIGKGAARAERRAGRVPGVIYGNSDYPLEPVRDFPVHVDFMRLGEGATVRVSVPLHVKNAETSPGVKRGGTVNIVTHTIDLECSVDNIPQYIEADVGALEISHSLHLSDIK